MGKRKASTVKNGKVASAAKRGKKPKTTLELLGEAKYKAEMRLGHKNAAVAEAKSAIDESMKDELTTGAMKFLRNGFLDWEANRIKRKFTHEETIANINNIITSLQAWGKYRAAQASAEEEQKVYDEAAKQLAAAAAAAKGAASKGASQEW